MNKILLGSIFTAFTLFQVSAANRYWISSGAGNWNNTANWSAASGGAGGASVPGAGDVAIFDGAGGKNGNCTFDMAPSVGGMSVITSYTGTIDLNGNTLTLAGTAIFTKGTIANSGAPASVSLNSSSVTFNGTLFSADVTGSSVDVYFNGSTFNRVVNITKTGGANDNSTGGNIFNGVTTITNNSAGQIVLGNVNRDQFNAVTTFNNTGSYRFYFAHNHTGQTTTFATDLILNSNKSGGVDGWSFFVCENANTSVSFGGKVTINCDGTLQSDSRFLNGNGTTATYSGTVAINVTNTFGNSVVQMGTFGTSTYNGNIVVSNSGIASGIAFNVNASATSTMSVGNTISIGAGGFTNGSLTLARFTQLGSTAQSLNTFSGTAGLIVGPGSVFNGNVNFVAPQLYLNGGNYNGTAYLEKNSAGYNLGTGNNTFASTATIVNSGSAQLRTNGSNTFNGTTTLTNSGSADLLLELTTGSTYNGDVTMNNTGSSSVRVAYMGSNAFNGNIIVNSTSGNGVYFSEQGTGTVTLATGKTISVGGLGFTLGALFLPRFTQLGGTAQSLTLTNTAALTIGPSSAFNGNVNFISPQVFVSGATYNGTAYIEKNGATDNAGTGGNIFNGTTTITNSGSGALYLGNGSSDQFNAATTFNNTGSYRFYFAHNHAGQTTTFATDLTLNSNKSGGVDPWSFFITEGANTNVSFGGNLTINNNGALQSNLRSLTGAGSTATFSGITTINLANTNAGTAIVMGTNGTSTYNGNIVVNNSAAASGIFFNVNATASSTLSSGNTILIGGAGFTGGTLSLARFTQAGTAAVTLTSFTGASNLTVGPNSSLGGNVNFVAPQIYLNGCTYNGTAYIEKNGATNNASSGGNTFSSATTLVNSGTSYVAMANTSPDIFNADLTVNNTGSSTILLAYTALGTQFNGNVIVSQANPGTGIYFGTNGGTSTMAATHTISIGSGYSSGLLSISNFTQNGSAPMSLTLTGSANLTAGPNSVIGGNVSFIAPRVLLNGTTYQGTAYIEKNGANNDAGTGNNIFQGVTTIVDSGSGYLLTGNTFPDVFNGDVTFTNTGSNAIYPAYNSTGNQFNGNILVNCTGGSGIAFSASAAGTSILANGKTISVGGTGFNTGQLQLIRFNQMGGTAQNLTLTGTAILTLGPSSIFNGNVNFVAPQLYLHGSTYNGTAYLEKNGATNNAGNGGNTFNSTCTLVCSGSGYLLTANVTADVFNNDATFTNTGSNVIYLAYNTANNQFNGNIIVNSTTGGGVYFSSMAPATSILASGKTISAGGSGFSFGLLSLSRFTQQGNTPQSLTLTNVAALAIGPASTFNGNVNFVAPQLYLSGCNYNGTAYLEKNGAGNNAGTGNNTFASTTTIVNSGSAQLRTNGNNTFNGTTTLTNSGSADLLLELTTGSTYNGDVTMNNTGSSYVRAAYMGANSFNGNIIVNSTSGTGVYFSDQGTGTVTLANTKTISVGGTGFTFGTLSLPRFTQVGGTAQSLTLTNVAALTVGPASTFNGNITFVTPTINLNGCTYNGTASITKTGATNDTSLGGNIFNLTTAFANSGTGQFINAGGGLDTFNNNLTLTNTGTSGILMSQTTSGTQFNGNIVVNSNNGIGIYFGNGGGASSMASGKTITIGGTGFSMGELRFYQFTQLGATAQSLTLTGTASFRIGNSSVFNGNVTFVSPQLYMDGATYNGTAYLEKNGAGYNAGTGNNTFTSTATIVNSGSAQLRTNGNNTFNGATTLTNSGSQDLLLELTTGSTYNGNVTMNNTGSSYVRAAYIGTNAFNGNIVVNSTNGAGVYFCENVAGTAALASGKTISAGGIGFTLGALVLQRFTQNGSTAQNITLTGTASFFTGPSSTWNGNLTVSSPQLFLNGATFNGVNAFTKTGTTTDNSTGGNTFAGVTTFNNTNIGVFRLSNTTGDVYTNNVIYNQNAGTIQPAYASATTYAGNITVNSSSAMVFGANSGSITFNGSGGTQTIAITGAAAPTFNTMVMNTSSGGTVNLNTIVNIGGSATFTSGVLTSSSTNYLNFMNNATTSGASNNSYVDGPVRKTGNQAFTFPVGTGGIYRSIAMSAPVAITDAFTAQFFRGAQAFGGAATYQSPILTVSSCEYWILNRTVGASNVLVTLSWNSPDCSGPYITDITKLLVARWNLTNWVSHGNGGTTGNATNGTVTSSAAVTSFSPFALASSSLVNPLPITLSYFKAILDNGVAKLAWETESELNNDFYTLERSADGNVFEQITTVKGAGTTSVTTDYSYVDENPLPGISYYRLKQTDFDRHETVVGIAFIENKGAGFSFNVYPNPVSSAENLNSNFSGSAIIYDALGQPVLTVNNARQMNVSSLSSGVYMVRTSTGQVQRLIIK
ncbi:MAG: T9SS type A sorting domain-containing protein [Bacteroidetes bacterium]|nr:T9SS type A sorting domain-containing protein [Bacteroidota bacterium]